MKKGDQFKMVQGKCACGHVGPQRRADQCGRCLREQTRETTPNKRQASRDRSARHHMQRCVERLIGQLAEMTHEQIEQLKEALDNLPSLRHNRTAPGAVHQARW